MFFTVRFGKMRPQLVPLNYSIIANNPIKRVCQQISTVREKNYTADNAYRSWLHLWLTNGSTNIDVLIQRVERYANINHVFGSICRPDSDGLVKGYGFKSFANESRYFSPGVAAQVNILTYWMLTCNWDLDSTLARVMHTNRGEKKHKLIRTISYVSLAGDDRVR